jgi:hypothetical protein
VAAVLIFVKVVTSTYYVSFLRIIVSGFGKGFIKAA